MSEDWSIRGRAIAYAKQHNLKLRMDPELEDTAPLLAAVEAHEWNAIAPTPFVWVNVHTVKGDGKETHLVKVWSGGDRITVAGFTDRREAAIHAARLADRNDWRPEHKRPLNEVMEFEHVIEVLDDGLIIDRPDLHAPELYDGELGDDKWTLMNGYSGQDRYSGPVMHNSEFIGGGMERDIRSEPGVYVALVCTWLDTEDEDEQDDNVEGWAVARLND